MKKIIILIIIFTSINITGRPSWRYYYKKGVIEYKANMDDFAIENLTRAIELNDRLYEAANILSILYQRQNNLKMARSYLEMSLQINDSQDGIHLRLGELLYYIGYLNKAAEHYHKAIKINPANIMANFNLVKYYFSKGNKPEAEKYFNRCYTIGKKEGEELHNKAVKIEQANSKKALMLYEESIKKCPVLIDSYFRISDIYRSKKDYIKAIEYLEKIKEFRPDYEKAYIYIAHLLYTRMKTKDRKQVLLRAADNLKKVIKLNPNNPEPFYLLHEIYWFLGEEEVSNEYHKKALELEGEKKDDYYQ